MSLEIWQQTFHDKAPTYRRMIDEAEARISAE
jgi:hypothetical protein